MFSTLFSTQGYQVSTASDGVEGFDAALRNEFHAVIADLNMPRLDGWGMLKMLRDDFRTRELPVAFISAHDDYRESLKALNAGAQAYFNKGGRLEALVGQVRKLLEPRELSAALVKGRGDFTVDIAAVGPQWLLKQLLAVRFTGRLDARDGFANYQLYIEGGSVKHAAAVAGRYHAEAERAFNAFVASRAAEGTVQHGTFPSPQSLFLSTEVLIERACATLNDNEQRVREGLMVSATQIDINEALYEVYRRIGPQQHLAVAKLICEDKVAPREVIAQIDTSPIEVEETLKDLVRRGVVQLRRG
jgi:CheY-like chemotaxis protein